MSNKNLLILTLFLFAFSLNFAQNRADKTPMKTPQNGEPTIIGGSSTDIENFPHQVALLTGDGSYHFCGGTIIDSQYILTASHCVVYENNGSVTKPSDILIVYGTEVLTDYNRQEMEVIEVIPHPSYNRNTTENDIAILKLANPLTLSNKAKIIPIATSTDVANGSTNANVTATVSGWGNTSTGNTHVAADSLQYVELPIVSNTDANNAYGGGITNDMLAAGVMGVGGKDACQGDSGGPLIVNNKNGNPILAGVVSWGADCADPNYPGLYARVSYFEDWIKANTTLGDENNGGGTDTTSTDTTTTGGNPDTTVIHPPNDTTIHSDIDTISQSGSDTTVQSGTDTIVYAGKDTNMTSTTDTSIQTSTDTLVFSHSDTLSSNDTITITIKDTVHITTRDSIVIHTTDTFTITNNDTTVIYQKDTIKVQHYDTTTIRQTDTIIIKEVETVTQIDTVNACDWEFITIILPNGDTIEVDPSNLIDLTGYAQNTDSGNGEDPAGMTEIKEIQIKIYPNPAQHTIQFEGVDQIDQVRIVDELGKHQKIYQSVQQIDISNLSSGVYFLEIYHNGTYKTMHFVKE